MLGITKLQNILWGKKHGSNSEKLFGYCVSEGAHCYLKEHAGKITCNPLGIALDDLWRLLPIRTILWVYMYYLGKAQKTLRDAQPGRTISLSLIHYYDTREGQFPFSDQKSRKAVHPITEQLDHLSLLEYQFVSSFSFGQTSHAWKKYCHASLWNGSF